MRKTLCFAVLFTVMLAAPALAQEERELQRDFERQRQELEKRFNRDLKELQFQHKRKLAELRERRASDKDYRFESNGYGGIAGNYNHIVQLTAYVKKLHRRIALLEHKDKDDKKDYRYESNGRGGIAGHYNHILQLTAYVKKLHRRIASLEREDKDGKKLRASEGVKDYRFESNGRGGIAGHYNHIVQLTAYVKKLHRRIASLEGEDKDGKKHRHGRLY